MAKYYIIPEDDTDGTNTRCPITYYNKYDESALHAKARELLIKATGDPLAGLRAELDLLLKEGWSLSYMFPHIEGQIFIYPIGMLKYRDGMKFSSKPLTLTPPPEEEDGEWEKTLDEIKNLTPTTKTTDMEAELYRIICGMAAKVDAIAKEVEGMKGEPK